MAYHIVTTWRLPARIAEVSDILVDVARLPEWWPAVYLGVEELEPGGVNGVGKVVALHTKGWLPYELRWTFRVTEVDPPRRLALEPSGDFRGQGVWTLRQEGPEAVVSYDWRVEARKPLLRALEPLLKPVFRANHDWAMRRGEESLRLELRRRRAASAAERARVPPPPGPTWPARAGRGRGAG